MSDEFGGLDATEKAGIEAALNRCRRVAAQIASELRNKRHEHFVDKLALADFYASLEHAANAAPSMRIDGGLRPPTLSWAWRGLLESRSGKLKIK